MSDKHLSLVKSGKEDDITEEDIENLNIDKLRSSINKGIYALEHALFTQTRFELNRLGMTREILTMIQDQLFTPEVIELLDPVSKMKLYNMLNQNMNSSLQFLQNLHNNLTDTIESTKRLEKEKSVQIPKDEFSQGNDKLDKIKEMILNKIKEKTTK